MEDRNPVAVSNGPSSTTALLLTTLAMLHTGGSSSSDEYAYDDDIESGESRFIPFRVGVSMRVRARFRVPDVILSCGIAQHARLFPPGGRPDHSSCRAFGMRPGGPLLPWLPNACRTPAPLRVACAQPP